MKRGTDTEITFSSLKPGTYDFDFPLNQTFFDTWKNDKIISGQVLFHVQMEKTERVMMLYISFRGEVETVCDRCLGTLTLPVAGEESLHVKFSDTEVSNNYDEVVLPTHAYKIDLAQQFYEMVLVSLPIQCVHPNNDQGQPECDPTMLKYLEEHQGDTQGEGADTHKEGDTDPRWDALKSLLNEEKK